MKNILPFILLFALISVGCHDDIIDGTTTTEQGEFEPDDLGFVTGKVTDAYSNGLSEVEVELYQDGELLGSVMTSSAGDYSTQAIEINRTKPFVLKYLKTAFQDKFRALEIDSGISIEKNVTLGGIEDLIQDDTVLGSPLDSNLVKLYGHARLSDGTPVAGVSCRAIWDYEVFAPGFFGFTQASVDITDIDGYWEIYVARDSVIVFNARYNLNPGTLNNCSYSFNPVTGQPNNDFGSLNYVNIGPFDSDTAVILDEDVELNLIRSTISGIATHCDGTPAVAGHLTARLGPVLGPLLLGFGRTELENYSFGSNGEYEITVETCRDPQVEQWGIQVSIQDTVAYWSGETPVLEYSEMADAGQANLCWDDNEYYGTLGLTLGQADFTFDNYYDNSSSGSGYLRTGATIAEGDHRTSCYIGVDDIQLGKNDLLWVRLRKGRVEGNINTTYETTIDVENPTNTHMYVESIDGNWVNGYIEGSIETISGVQDIYADFRIYDK